MSAKQSQGIRANPDPQEDKLSQRIKSARITKGYSQVAMANMLGTDRANYHRLESRGSKLTIEQLERIAQALGVTAASMLTEELIEIPQAVEENIALKARNKELEDRVRDKQQIMQSYERSKAVIWWHLGDIFFRTAKELNIIVIPSSAPPSTLGIEDSETYGYNRVWGEPGTNAQGEKVISYDGYQLTASDLKQIYTHLMEQNEATFDFMRTLLFSTDLFTDTLASEVLYTIVLGKLNRPFVSPPGFRPI